MTEKKKLLLLINPHAGKSAVRNKLLGIVDRFVKGGYEVSVYITQRSGELPDVVAKQAANFNMVVCSGGDGTLNETVNGLMRCETPPALGYIPAGTTNDFAASFSLPRNMEAAAEVAMEGQLVYFDVGKFNNSYFAYVAAFGAFTDVPYVTPQETKNALGKLAYLLEGARRLPTIQAYPIRLEYDGGVIEDDILVGVVSNSRYVAGLPMGERNDASMCDGLMEVILVKKPGNALELTPLINTFLMGEMESDLVYTFKTQSLHLHSEVPISWTLDGEYGGQRTDVIIENQKEALGIMAPAEASKTRR
ncbi:MAG: YegS/Rv2252/BmrU family lipid kinase [Clostridiaceae bacterium]|nr:YegS/Rv2252/BmrU family lipid kinase [Clostridiaceae bacterium]